MCRSTRWLPPLALLLASALAAPALADSRRDLIEHMFGAGRDGAVGGHGGLTVAVAADGDLTVLSWPSPGLRDHLASFTSNAIDARALPRSGAHEGMGSFLGLRLAVEGAEEPQLTWLRDAPWQSTQGYSGPLAPVPVTTFLHPELDLEVVVTDVVSPEVDVLTRWVRVELGPSSPVVDAELVVYENLAPSVSQIEQLPVGDWALDPVNDFAALWDRDSDAILHVHPGDRAAFLDLVSLIGLDGDVDYGPIETLLQDAAPSEEDVAATVAALDLGFAPGVSALVTTEPAPIERQIGSDATPLCALLGDLLDNLVALPEIYPDAAIPLDADTAAALRCQEPLDRVRADHGWLWQPEDALADLADGSLSGSPVAAARTNGALIAPMERTASGFAGSAVFAFGATVAEARGALASARERSPAERLAASEAAAEAALGDARLPDPELGERVVEVARRALVNLYVARDRDTGALVASVARQPPYFLDWPRDGAFFTAALDLAGLTDWASQRFRWYVGLQRRTYTRGLPVFTPYVPIDPDDGEQRFPRYAWEMNYYPDGALGGPIRFEIDNSALHVWSLALHAAHLDPEARAALLDEVWPSTADALDTLARWRDPETGLPAPANEDDHLELTSKLHGAVTVHAALEAGARLAEAAGEPARGRGYLARAEELRAAILTHYLDEEVGLFRAARGGEAGAHGGSTAWMAWPGRVLEPGDPVLEAQLAADMERALEILEGEPYGGSYQAKAVLSAAIYGAEGGARDRARAALELLAGIATADTHHFGEVYVPVVDEQGALTWSNRVATPHVWHGALFYLAAMALSAPDDFDLDQEVLPLPAPAPEEGGCGCRAAGGGAGGIAPWALAALLLRRRRARSC